MTVGFRNSAGVDFDSLFDPFIAGTPPAATGFRASTGVDLAGRYAPIAFGTKGPDVGFRNSAGVDLSNLWAAIGTASYAITGLQGKSLLATDNAVTLQPNVSATVQANINNNGTWSVSGGNSGGAVAQPAPTSGTWLPGGSAVADFEVQIDVSSSGSAGLTVGNNAPAYAAATTTRSFSLTLPTAPANNANERTGAASVRIRIRRIATGVVVSDTTFTANISTTGYL